MNDFHSRFKEKVSHMNKNGLLDVKSNFAVTKKNTKEKALPTTESNSSPNLNKSVNYSIRELPKIKNSNILPNYSQLNGDSSRKLNIRYLSPQP